MTLTGELYFRPISLPDLPLLQAFLHRILEGRKHFRYFDSRELQVIENHLYTVLLMDKEGPVGYGHLDPEGKRVWLGMAIGDDHRGKGLGQLMLDHLLAKGMELGINKLDLAVDDHNDPAIKLYERVGFNKVDHENDIRYYRKWLN